MRNILLKIEYDGTEFSGWQRQPQPEVRTVQGEIEETLSRLCGQEIRIDGTGRTDAGVHALGQCATFSGDFGIPVERLAKAANDILADSRQKCGPVRIISAEEVPEGFHARFSAKGKTYVYRICNAENMPVFMRNYRYHVKQPLDTDAMKKAAAAFPGKRDFEAFMAMGSNPQETTVRTIFGVNIETRGSEINISVTGDGFLYNMVRIIAGTLIEVGKGKMKPEDIKMIMEARDRQKAGPTAPAHGLTLVEIEYPEWE